MMRLVSREQAKHTVTDEMENLLLEGARYVLLKSGPEFMAVRFDETFISKLEEVDAFMSDISPSRRADAIRQLVERAATRPNHLAIVIAIFHDDN